MAQQPSPPVPSPSSQASPCGADTVPLPQFRVQTLGSPAQVYPLSTVHALEHPSPPAVSPSSHDSPASSVESPHSGVQTLGEPLQLQPGSTSHVAEQPSPPVASPSSHPSPSCTMPSAHSGPQLPFEPLPSSNRSQSRARPSTSFARRQSWHPDSPVRQVVSAFGSDVPHAGNACARSTPVQRATMRATLRPQTLPTAPLLSGCVELPVPRQLDSNVAASMMVP